MPIEVVGLLGLFIAVSIGCGALAVIVTGPRRPPAVILPIGGSFASLYLIGHRLDLSIGPVVSILGFEVSLAWDLTVALATAIGVALVQRAALRGRERSAGTTSQR
jgi:hypothetical protein